MKIRKLTPENHSRVSALLRCSFPSSKYEERLVDNLHTQDRLLHEWFCVHANKIIAYIAFSKAYRESEVIGFHLFPLAVNPGFQNQGVGSELIRFALRQNEIEEQTIFVLGASDFFKRFGFVQCLKPTCRFDKNNKHFMVLRESIEEPFIVGYEPEF